MTTPAVPVPGETLYRRKPNGRYEPVSYQIDTFCRFPRGRWVLMVDGNSSCCLKPLPNTDEAMFAALQKFRWVLQDAIAKHSRASVSGELTEKQMKAIRDIAGDALVWFTTEAAGTVALKATEEFERQCLQREQGEGVQE